jgi:hypothetical protein
MKLGVIQHRPRATSDADAVTLAEWTARSIARGADVLVSDPLSAGEALAAVGRCEVLTGDAAIDPEVHRRLAANPPDVLVLAPESESELQAEAAIEVAIGLSLSIAGLVIVLESAGAEPGEPGHGGSAIVLLGEVAAEALQEDEALVAQIPVPIPYPEPRAPLPAVPPLLLQRLAHHRGETAPVDYPVDL